MSRWDDIKNKKSNISSSEEDANLSRWEKVKKAQYTAPTDHSDFEQFVTDYENFAKSDYDEKTASELKNKLTNLTVLYNLNRVDLGEEEQELKNYLNKVKYSIISYGNASKASAEYDDLMSAENFKENSGYTSTRYNRLWDRLWSRYGLGYADLTYEYINNQDGLRDEIKSKYRTYSRDNSFAEDETDFEQKGYEFLTAEEIEVYNYYYSTEGKDKAQEFLDSIEDTLIKRKAGKEFEALEGDTLKELFYGVVSGADQWRQGTENFGDYLLGGDGFTSSSQYVSGMVREDLADDGFKILGSSVGQIGYDLINTTTNMLPTILVGAATGGLGGVAALGVSAVGNSYAEMRKLGYDEGQARSYATLVGASEATLQYLLGGISKLGGKVTGNVVGKFVSSLDNALAKVAIKLGGSMLSEGLEESIQTVVEPVFKAWVTGEEFEAAKLEDILYSGLIGALSAGVLEGGGTIAGEISANTKAKELYGDGSSIVSEALGVATKGSELEALANKYKGKLDGGKSLSGGQIVHLDEAIRSNDVTTIKKAALRRLGELGETTDVTPVAEVLTKYAQGEKLSSKDIAILNNSDYGHQVLAEINKDNIKSGGLGNNWAENIGTRRISPEAYNKGVYELAKMAVGLKEYESQASVSKELAESKGASDVNVEVSDNGKNMYYDAETNSYKDADIKRIVSTKGGIKVELENGKTVKASDLRYASREEGVMYAMLERMEATPDTANEIMNTFKPSNPKQASLYYDSIPLAYRMGLMGNEQGLKFVKLTDAQKRILYNRGRIDAVTNAKERDRAIATSPKKATAEASKTGKNGIIYEGDFVYDEATAKDLQKAGMAGAEAIAKTTNLEVHVFESFIKDGNRVAYVNGKLTTAPNGYFTGGNKIYIDINAGMNAEGAMLYALSHEVTHYIRKWNPKGFKDLADFLIAEYGKQGVDVTGLIARQKGKIKKRHIAEETERIKEQYESEGKAIPSEAELEKMASETLPSEAKLFDMAYEELVADAMSDMLADPKAYEKLAKLKKKNFKVWKKLGEVIKQVLDKLKKALGLYRKYSPVAKEAYEVRDFSVEVYNKLQDLYIKAFVEADNNYSSAEQTLVESGIAVNPNTDSASLLSVRDVLNDDQRKKVSLALAERFGVTQQEAMDWLKAETSMASLILNPKYSQYLDYTPDPNEVAIKTNSDYPQGTVDFSPICAKRREFTSVMNNILRLFPNHVFAATDLAKIRTIMQEEGMTIPCGICYVEDRRQLDTIVAQNFIDSLKLYREGSKTRPDGKPFNANQLKGLSLIDGDSYTPSVYELVSLEGLNVLKEKNPNMAEAWVKFNNARGMQSVRLLANEAEYKRQILKYSKKTVQTKNDHGGLRVYSFSDAEMFHLIDIIQVITDSATVGLSLQGYTKVNEYARAVKDTGEKLNRSLIPKGELGYHIEDGKVVLDYDTVEGIDINHPDFFDNRDNPNVGNITIGVSDVQIRAAMVSDFVDQIIPFHTGQSEEVLGEKGIATWSNYKDFQTEKDVATGKVSDHQINIYTEVLQVLEKEGKPINKRTFVEKFLQVCKENNLTPRFSQFLNTNEKGEYVYTEGYHKMLVDFKTFAQTEVGEYLPQMPVKPIFDNEYITKILKDYVKSQKVKDAELAESMPKVIERITNEIVKPGEVDEASETKYSDRDSVYLDAVNRGDMVTAQRMVYEAAKKAGYTLKGYHGTETGGFTVFGNSRSSEAYWFAADKTMAESYIDTSSMGSEHWSGKGKTSLYETFVKAKNPLVIDADGYRAVTIPTDIFPEDNGRKRFHHIDDLAFFAKDNGYDALIVNNVKDYGYYIEENLGTDDVGKLPAGTVIAVFDPEQVKSADPVTYDDNGNVIPLSERFNAENDDIRFSDRDSYAPTFYSHMGKVIDAIRLEKMGANGVVSYLKGKGVKDEEIKWSGIEAFLEGKKSITKAELQEFVAGSQLQIVEQISGEDIDLRYDGSNRAYSLYDSDGNVIDTYTYNEFLDGYVADSDEEIYSNDIELKEALREEYGKASAPRWEQYKLDGGSNYRELVFQLPNSTYSNNAMRVHWGQDAEGVLAHARIQDFIVNGKKMLFIEELQSDWHNEGLQKGYTTKEYEDAVAVYDKLAEDYANKRRAFNQYVRSSEFHSDPDEVSKKKFDWLRSKMETAEKRMQDAERDIEALKKKGMGDVADAPFRDNYHEYVLKRLLRMAAEEGYDSIGWTPSNIQSDRWSDEFAEAYRIEYDQEMPKFLRKYGKKWGATVGEATVNDTQVWSMDIPSPMKESVLHEGQVLYSDRTDIVDVNGKEYDHVIELDYKTFNKVKRNGTAYIDFIRNNLINKKITVYNSDGDSEIIEFAKTNERVKKDGSNNFRRVLGELEQARNPIKKLVITNAEEVAEISQIANHNSTSNHQWLDANGWDERTSYVLTKEGVIYPVVLHIAKTKDGRNILYDANVKIKEGISIDKNATSLRAKKNAEQAVKVPKPSDELYHKNKGLSSETEEKFSDRDTDAVSNRTLLANALESVAKNDIEKTKLTQYKEKIALIESEQKKLEETRAKIKELSFAKGARDTEAINKLQFEANQTANRINTYDKQLLNLESTKALKGVLEREKATLRKRLEKQGKEAINAQKAKNAETVREIMTRNTESRKKAVEGRHKTEMRHKIQKVVSDLNKLLLNPTKEQHVPIGLQKVVADALDAINMDTMNAEERVKYYNDLIAKSNNPDDIKEYTKKRDFFEYRDMNFKERITALKNAYAEFKESEDPLIRNAHNDAIADLIKNTADAVGNNSLKDMSLGQLEAVYDMYKAILATVRNANKLFKEGRQETVTECSEAVKAEVKEVGGHKERVLKLAKFFKRFGWNMLKPVTAMKVIGSNTFAKLFDNVRAAEDTWAVDVREAKEFYEALSKKYGYNKWGFKEQYTFKDSQGEEFSISLEQMLSLYAYSKREQADEHLEFGGFIFDDAIEVTEKNKLGIPVKYEVNDANPRRLGQIQMMEIIGKLTQEQKAFVDEMQTYLSEVMGAKGNEVSLALYDIKLYKEKNYFPLKTARYFREFDPEKSGTPKIKNSGFSKKTVPQAGNPIVLSNFMDVWASHVNDMSMYHAFVLPLEDFMRVYNYSSTTGGYDSVQQYIKNAYGSQANQYIERLMDDLNGGARVDSSADPINKGISLFKKASVFASASVVIQQPSAIARAFAYINPKYFVTSIGSALNLKKHKEVWAEVKKYAPVAIIKEMGYFDTGMGRSTVEWIKGNKTLKDKMDDALSKAPAMADELSWSYIWLAVKNEIKATTNLAPGSEEFLAKVGERFTEIITNTQVYDSVLSRSGMMRSKDTGMKMATAFMAEPTTTVNMMVDGIIQGKRGNKKFTAATIGAVSSSVILNSILVALVYAARDDDEDETYIEKYVGSLTTELVDGFNPLTYIPFVKDFWSILQGFDVERADMTLVTNLVDSLQQVVKVLAKDTDGMNENELNEYHKDVNESILSIIDNATSLFGVPIKNIRRDINAIINTGKTIGRGDQTTLGSLKDTIGGAIQNSTPVLGWLPDESKSNKVYDAIMSGDSAYVARLKNSYKDADAYETAVRKALRENDSRIRKAAQARYEGNIAEYTRIAKEIIAEGNFSQDTVVGAINAEISAIKRGETTEEVATEDKDEATSIYSASDMNNAFNNGDNSTALGIIDDLVETKVANGMTEKEAKSSLRSSMTSYWKPLYKEAYQSGDSNELARIRRILYASGLYGSANEVVKTTSNWLKD